MTTKKRKAQSIPFPLTERGYFSTPDIRHATVSSGGYVTMLQRRLGLTETGRYDDTLRVSVVQWQRAHGVEGTGVVDRATWDLLFV